MNDNTVYKSIIIGTATKWKSNNNSILNPINIKRFWLPAHLYDLNLSAINGRLDTISQHIAKTNSIRTIF